MNIFFLNTYETLVGLIEEYMLACLYTMKTDCLCPYRDTKYHLTPFRILYVFLIIFLSLNLKAINHILLVNTHTITMNIQRAKHKHTFIIKYSYTYKKCDMVFKGCQTTNHKIIFIKCNDVGKFTCKIYACVGVAFYILNETNKNRKKLIFFWRIHSIGSSHKGVPSFLAQAFYPTLLEDFFPVGLFCISMTFWHPAFF